MRPGSSAPATRRSRSSLARSARPRRLAGWQQGAPVATRLPLYADHSVGILTRATPALDIDVKTEALANDIQLVADRVLGDAPIRYGERPKRLMPFALRGEPFSKLRLAWKLDEEVGAVEVLAAGQQFVALGRHPCGTAYVWERDPDLTIPHGLLPPLDQTRAIGFLRTLASVLRRLGALELKAGGGWALEPRQRPPTPVHRAAEGDQPPWHAYTARELAHLIDPEHAHQTGSWWRCACPVHQGQSHTSLAIKDAEDGHPGWHCFGSCSDRDIARAIAEILK